MRAVRFFFCSVGSQLDYMLQQKADKEPKISRSIALRRFHWRMSLWENAVHRLTLLKVLISSSATEVGQMCSMLLLAYAI